MKDAFIACAPCNCVYLKCQKEQKEIEIAEFSCQFMIANSDCHVQRAGFERIDD